MNAILLGAASLGAFVAIFTGNPSEQDAKAKLELARAEQVTAERAATVEDRGEMKRMTIVDPKSGETTNVSVISFAD
jgi:hypothetical protein